MASVQMRQATPADAAAVLAVKRAAIREVAGWHYDADQIDAWAPDESALPEFVRRDIATSLVRHLEMRARMRSITELTIVASMNAASFYESLGYWTVDTRTRTIEDADLEFAVMRKRLDANWPQ